MGTWWVVAPRCGPELIPITDFRRCCIEKLEELGDAARDSRKHDEATGYYSNALSLDPTNLGILLKRSNKVWPYFTPHQMDLTDPSSQLIELDPSSYRGYEGKHTALHGMGRHREALEAFRTMLSKLEKSSDPQIRGKLFFYSRGQSEFLIDVGQSFIVSTSTQLPQFDRWSSRLFATCHVSLSTLLLVVCMIKLSKLLLSRNSRSMTSCALQ